ncbi:uncharacterized protein MONOS_8751 [Monocercomonoides exilis]|uniref:uncharacterized protein n=1 Tax=Monocercomonoides exilis TaxID=2049356 RepID=UPI003559E0FC|nr:hypothetical protein MONOS_8751 [Monocercomonoides exilis]|eukprot:MONOS_8751.1-p1 / transcript=MONOS_8751.1 / gene=MONOS_8751 / organism=Monocercomonoides_exilis_PA203 / gene_product=unspecified product / transcript_product=unspecified product / location=Mono_scaffold00338:52550-53132(-) / protein_length=177 / sequence_SO=supercontig / SO=protein_coding / is_pseudo=false
MHTVVPTVAKKGEGKATVVQRMFMLLEQTTDSRGSEESEWPVTSPGGSGAGLSSAGDVPLQAGSTARERPMSAVSGSLEQETCKSAHVLRVPHSRRSSVQMKRLLNLLKIGLQPQLTRVGVVSCGQGRVRGGRGLGTLWTCGWGRSKRCRRRAMRCCEQGYMGRTVPEGLFRDGTV